MNLSSHSNCDSQVFRFTWSDGFLCRERGSMKEKKRWMRRGKSTAAAVSTGRSDHRAGVIMADVFLQMSLFLLRRICSTRTQRLIESSGLNRLLLGRAGNGCLWPIITSHGSSHTTDLKHYTKHTRLIPVSQYLYSTVLWWYH